MYFPKILNFRQYHHHSSLTLHSSVSHTEHWRLEELALTWTHTCMHLWMTFPARTIKHGEKPTLHLLLVLSVCHGLFELYELYKS